MSDVQALANGKWLTRFTNSGWTFFPKTLFFECPRPRDSKNCFLLVKHSLAHDSTYSNKGAFTCKHNTTHHHTPPHTTLHTTHSAPATFCNMSETLHHYLQQDQAHFIQSGARSARVCLDDLLGANISPNSETAKAHALWACCSVSTLRVGVGVGGVFFCVCGVCGVGVHGVLDGVMDAIVVLLGVSRDAQQNHCRTHHDIRKRQFFSKKTVAPLSSHSKPWSSHS